jgi:hypothetical protein
LDRGHSIGAWHIFRETKEGVDQQRERESRDRHALNFEIEHTVTMAELKRLFASLENAELTHRAHTDNEHSLILNQLHALSAHSHMVKHKYLTTMKDTFAGLFRERLRFFSMNTRLTFFSESGSIP